MRAIQVVILAATFSVPALAEIVTPQAGETALNVPSGVVTVTLPPDGVLHYSSVTVSSGATLKFTPNSMNTPVYVLSSGDISIAGTVDVSGLNGTASPPVGGTGGPGGYSGGSPQAGGLNQGDGHGPGAGQGGTNSAAAGGAGAGAYGGAASCVRAGNGTTYGGPLLIPLVGGSGGGGGTGSPGNGGGGGGGAILFASNTEVSVSGSVKAMGGRGASNGYCSDFQNHGSGGAIRLVAPVVKGNGYLNVEGGSDAWSNTGGRGRIRIDATDRTQAMFTQTPANTATFGAFLSVFPANMPRIDVVEVAGTPIVGGASATVSLPFGSPGSQPVRVRATNFAAPVQYYIVLTPETGSRSKYGPLTIDSSAGPVEQSTTVDIPANNVTRVDVWTQ